MSAHCGLFKTLALFLVFCFVLGGCGAEPPVSGTDPASDVSISDADIDSYVEGIVDATYEGLTGNTSGNISNEGFAAAQGDWIYVGNHGLYKMKADGSEKQLLFDGNAANINVYKDRVYFETSGYNGSERVYSVNSIKTDGSDLQVLFNTDVAHLSIVGGKLYYTFYSDLYSDLCSINLDGTGRSNVLWGDLGWVGFDSDNIYYAYAKDYSEYSIHIMDIDTSTHRDILVAEVISADVADGKVYYSLSSGGIYSIDSDGSNNITISQDCTYQMNISDGRMYYVTSPSYENDSGTSGGLVYTICSMNLDGSDQQKLHEDYAERWTFDPETGGSTVTYDHNPYNVCVAGGRVYFHMRSDGFNLYSMKLDGSDIRAE